MYFRLSLILSLLCCNLVVFGQIEHENNLSTTRSALSNIKIRGSLNKFTCAKFGSCKANENFSFKTCYCDGYCKHFGDCCFDADFTNNVDQLPDKCNFLSCVKLVPAVGFQTKANQGFQMVSKCPRSIFAKEFVKKCENDLDNDIPVTDEKGLTYKNKYCALCHGVVDHSFWNTIFMLRTCDRNFDYSSISETNMAKRIDILKEHGCHMVFIPHNPYDNTQKVKVFPRFCIDDVTTDFNNNGEECRKIFNPAFNIKTSLYVRNTMCLNYNYTRDDIQCLLPNSWYKDLLTLRYGVRPMTVLFQFKNYDQKDNRQVCAYSYKDTKAICQAPSCNITYSNPCVKESVDSYQLGIKLYMESGEIYIKTFERAMMMFFMSLPTDHYQLKLLQFRLYVSCKESEHRSCCFFGNVPIVIQRNIIYDELTKFKTAVQNMKYIYHEKIQNMTFTVHRKTENFTCRKDTVTDISFLSLDTVQMYMENIDMETITTNHSDVPDSSEVKVQVSDELDSRGIASYIKVLSLKKAFPIQTNPDLFKAYLVHAQVIITYSTMGLSSLALVIVISIYAYFKLYIKLGDQICINVMCTMLLTNVLFMCGIGFVDNHIVCYIIGVALHFLWLCVFTWVSLFTIVFTVTLWKMEKNLAFNPDRSWSKCPLYFFGYGIPAMITSSCILLQTILSEFYMQYNGHVCFPTGFPENIIFFTTPIVLTIAVNVLLLVIASKLLKKQYMNSLIQTTQDISIYIAIVIKLCLFSGIFWIFGVLSQVFENDVLAFIFIICCGLQGLIFAVCFVTSTKVRRKHFGYMNKVILNRTPQRNEEMEMKYM